MAEQIIKTRIINKHDIPSNWIKAVNFVPKQGEIIIYDKEDNPDMYSGYSNPFLAPEGYHSIFIGFKFTTTDNTLVFKDKDGKVLLSYENIDNYLELNKFYYISIAQNKTPGVYDGTGPDANKVTFSSSMGDFPFTEYKKIEAQIRTIQTVQKENELKIYYKTIFNETKLKIGDGVTLVNNLPFIESKVSSIIGEEILKQSKTYADTKDAETLESAKSYTDEKNKAEMTSRVHFGDIGSLPDAAGGISRIKFYANGYPTIESGSPLSVSIYNGSGFLASVSAPVGFGGDDYLDCDAEGNFAVSWMRGNVQMQMLEADDFIRKMAEADSVIIYDSNAEMTYADVTYTATVSAKLDSEIERAKSAESETLENAKGYADTKAAAAEENAKTYGKQTFAGALKGEKLGSIVRLDDVSALDRRLDTVVSSKNIIPFPYAAGNITKNGLTFTVGEDGSITLNGTATKETTVNIAYNLNVEKGCYTLSSKTNTSSASVVMKIGGMYYSDGGNGKTVSLENDTIIELVYLYVKKGTIVDSMVIMPQLELNTSATAYTKHVSDLSGVSVKKYGKNFFDCYGISANSIENPGASCSLSNKYNTTIDKTALSSASDVLTVTQSAHPNETQKFSYTNGFFCIGLSNLIEGQAYTLSFDFTATDDPFSMMSNFTGNSVYALLNGSTSAYWKKVSRNRYSVSFTYTKKANSPLRRYIEFRLYGMSGTFSAFQLEPLSTASAYVPWSAPTTYTVGADGTVQNLSANEDVTTLVTDNEGTVLKTKYSRDLGAAFNAETLESVKNYADSKDRENLTAAKSYADTKDSKTLASAKSYADTKAAEISASAKTDVSALQNDIAELKEDIVDLQKVVGIPSKEKRYISIDFDLKETGIVYNTSNKNGVSWSGGDSYILGVNPNEKYMISTTVNKASAYYGVLYYNDSTQINGEFQGNASEYIVLNDEEFTIPDGVNKIIVSTLSSVTPTIKKETEVTISPESGLTIDVKELKKSSASKYYCKYDGTDLFVKTRYNSIEDIVFNFRKRGNNNLIDFNKIFLVTNNGNFTKSLTESRNLVTSNTDWFSPHQVRAKENIDGDDSTSYFLTGGNHNKESIPTANCDNIVVRVNNKIVSNFDDFCNDIEISWVNHIQGHNTWKADGTGRAILDEKIRLVFESHKINVCVENIPTEDIYHNVYYGLQSIQTPFNCLRYVGSSNRAKITPTVINNSIDLKCRKILSTNDNGDNLVVCIDNYDYGTFELTGATYSAFNMNNKTYFAILRDKTVTQKNGELYTLTGYYDFYSTK